MEEKQISKQAENLPYKAIFGADGVGLLFEKIYPFGANDVHMNVQGKAVRIHMGKNIVPITANIMLALRKHRTFFLYESPRDDYDTDSMPITFELEESAMAMLEELWEKMQAENEESRAATSSSQAGHGAEEAES